MPKAETIGVLVNPNAPAANVEPQVRGLELAAKSLGLRLHVLKVAGEPDASVAFDISLGSTWMPCSSLPMHYSAANSAIHSWRWRHVTVCQPFILGATTSRPVD